MGRIKDLIKNFRIILLLVFLVFALASINPNPLSEGVAIRSVAKDSVASFAGFESPKPNAPPMSRERVIAVNNVPIIDLMDYYDFADNIQANRTYQIKTNKGLYVIETRPLLEFNESVIIGVEPIGLSVYKAPKSNIRKGLELQGGTRVIMQPDDQLTSEDMDTLIVSLKQRLNVYGLSDIVVREAGDLSGNQYVLIEIAGFNEEEVKDLLAKQGKFEAKIANVTAFIGGQDITYVCRSADCAGIDPLAGCSEIQNGWTCRFRFSISLTPEAAQKHANITSELTIVSEADQDYLSENLDLFLDDELVDTLRIGSELRNRAVTDIQISGSGVGITRQEGVTDSLKNMKRLQTILITGSLPTKLNIVKMDSISPLLGTGFIKNSIVIGLTAILAVGLVVFLRYRKLRVVVPMIFTSLSEVILLLGLASLIGWNIDLAAIAGIIIAVGTGIDHQIIIADEAFRKEEQRYTNWRSKIKKAFFIIMAAYSTTVVAMLPLWFAGAGLLKGFAITTIFGLTFGVFLTRPAFASIIQELFKE